MILIFIDNLSPQTRRGGVFKLLIEQGNVEKTAVGKIVVNGGMATVEVEESVASKVVKKLDGLAFDGGRLQAWQQVNGETLGVYFQNQLRWLDWEAQEEQKQYAEQKRDLENSLSQLVVKSEDVTLGGRILLRLAPKNEQKSLPWSKLSVGTPIVLSAPTVSADDYQRGVISQMRRSFVEIVINQALHEALADQPTLTISRSNDAVGRQRMVQALSKVASANHNRLAEIRDVILGEQDAYFVTETAVSDTILSPLNPSQQEALQHGMQAQDIALIHGPPGTGKTTTVVALIRAAIEAGEKVLACAPSHTAVDNLCESLVLAGENVLRLGHPARIADSLLPYTLDAQVAENDEYKLAKKLRKEAMGLKESAGKWRRAKPEKGAKQAMQLESKAMLKEARQLESRAVEQVLDRATVLLSTLTGIDSSLIGGRQFDLCVVDEAGQTTQAATWIPITRANRVVLAGDHCQLPPTILSKRAEEAGFGKSLLEMLMNQAGGALSRQLIVQYRMNEAIMAFSSQTFYDNSLLAHESVKAHLLTDLANGNGDGLLETAVTYIDTAGASYDEELEQDGTSRLNPQEAQLIAKKAQQLFEAGLNPNQIGIITPYAAQVRLLRELLGEEIEIFSVDGFQGREKEAILISLVRANENGDIGFLSETRRMNVALTRARRKLLVIGDSATITAHSFFADLVTHWEETGAYHSVWEEL
ncbi:MAG: AAA domain-containing protein [Chloroflexota bacterium]